MAQVSKALVFPMNQEQFITEFLGTEPSSEGYIEPDRYTEWEYDSGKLKYKIILDRKYNSVSISGDFEYAFSATSLYELCIIYDHVALETEEKFYGKRPILVFRKDYDDFQGFKVLMIMKWDSGELSIWPQIYECHKELSKDWK